MQQVWQRSAPSARFDIERLSGTRVRDGATDGSLTAMRVIGFIALALMLSAGCRQRMAEQPRYDPLESSDFFEDGQSARHPVPGTVARGELRADTHFYAGLSGRAPAKIFPFTITLDLLRRGQERYNIYCSPCHSRTGNGDGMIVRRGYFRPPSFHSDRLRQLPPGHLFRVITGGFGAMPAYGVQIHPHDRWAIVAYIRALQLSRNASLSDVPPEQRRALTESRSGQEATGK